MQKIDRQTDRQTQRKGAVHPPYMTEADRSNYLCGAIGDDPLSLPRTLAEVGCTSRSVMSSEWMAYEIETLQCFRFFEVLTECHGGELQGLGGHDLKHRHISIWSE